MHKLCSIIHRELFRLQSSDINYVPILEKIFVQQNRKLFRIAYDWAYEVTKLEKKISWKLQNFPYNRVRAPGTEDSGGFRSKGTTGFKVDFFGPTIVLNRFKPPHKWFLFGFWGFSFFGLRIITKKTAAEYNFKNYTLQNTNKNHLWGGLNLLRRIVGPKKNTLKRVVPFDRNPPVLKCLPDQICPSENFSAGPGVKI